MEKRSHCRETEIPNKLYFRIGEVSDLVGVKPYVLRYWESEFPDIKPTKSKSGQRLYKRRDVETLVKIRELLYEERFTINGARKRLKDFGRPVGVETHESEELPLVVAQPKVAQLEVFEDDAEETEEIIEEPVVVKASVKAVAAAARPAQKDNAKVLVKIKRDLESLLSLVRD